VVVLLKLLVVHHAPLSILSTILHVPTVLLRQHALDTERVSPLLVLVHVVLAGLALLAIHVLLAIMVAHACHVLVGLQMYVTAMVFAAMDTLALVFVHVTQTTPVPIV
jgi:hypothetical protein